MRVLAICLNTFREALRNKILYSVLFFAVLLIGISAFFGAVSIGQQEQVIKNFGLFSLSFFGAIITILSGVSLLSKELKQKTVYNILSKPIKRWEFILGKYLGLTLTVCLLVALMGVGLVIFVACFERRVDWLLFQGVFFVCLEVMVMAAVIMFFSSIAVTVTLTGVFSLGTYIAGRSISYLVQFMHQGGDFSRVLVDIVKVFDWILPDLSVFNINDTIVYGVPICASYALYALVYCLSYSAIALVLAMLIFSQREMN
jgi:ABC-type transport system involved in multi-copper enzyme maturation permease subunit